MTFRRIASFRPLAPAAVSLLLLSCGTPPPPEGSTAATGSEAPEATASASTERDFLGSDGCADCHPAEAAAHAGSPHALDLQAVVGEPPEAADGRPVDDDGVLVTHRIGSRRRQVWLGVHDGSLQVLPSARSMTRDAWIDHRADDGIPPGGADAWKRSEASWRERCAGCHPNAGSAAGPEVALTPEEARGLAPGIGCEHCHGAGAEHARLARTEPEAVDAVRASIVRGGTGPWEGCAHCHAVGDDMPLARGEALRAGDDLSDHRRIATAIDPVRPDARFLADGRPAQAHGFSAISFAQSRCFREGKATCLTCHDPHGGGLNNTDPDAACRDCHEAQAGDGHSGHVATTRPTPSWRDEPRGPEPSRAPGCVDCHAPALLAFGSVDRARDHAFGIPEPELTRDFATPDACTACHGDRDPQELVDWLDERHRDRDTPRHRRASAFKRSLGLSAIGQAALARDAVEPLLEVLENAAADPGLRATAASALGKLGAEATPAGPALLDATASDSLELAQAATAALGQVGTEDIPRLRRVAREHRDWRVRLVAAASLDALSSADGATELEVLAASDELPTLARAQARLQLGIALLRRGLFERALFQLDESIQLDGSSIPAWLNLGVARAGLGDEEGARLAWLTVNDLEPGNLAARRNVALLDQRLRERAP
jgi:Flp pilus assembly protein TadD